MVSMEVESEGAEENVSVTEVTANSDTNSSSYCKGNDEHDKKKRHTGKY